MVKRLIDIIGSLLGILVTWPVWVVAAVWIKFDSPGPVFYRGWRVGRGGKLFRIFKFRTMVVDAERTGVSSTSDRDRRITRVGRWLRKYKLDELPQLVNVLCGQMSLVGPRPEVPRYVELYTEEERAILTVRPGITDWASLWNADEGAVLAGTEDPDRAYELWIRPTKLRLQLEYVRRHNVWIDVKILVYTLIKLFRKDWLPKELASYGRPEVPKQRLAA